MARSDSPLPSGPSHPYGMYPQNTVARTSSVTTAPTPHLPQPPASRQGPTHPYGMYPQNTVEDEVPLPVVQAAIPVGFPGLPTGYHRQIGPDGEEQDIIGPDGHTEQLPPYTRWPEEGPTKAALAAEVSASPIETLAVPVAVPVNSSNAALVSPVSPTSSISSLSPAPSVDPPTPPQPQEEQRRETPVAAASIQSPSSEQILSEKEPARSLKAKNWRSKKLWGRVPMGVALFLLVLVLIFAVILGAAIGTFVAKNKDKSHKGKSDKGRDDPAPQMTGPGATLFDATPITAPTSLPSLPTGAFALPLGMPQESNPSCLVQPNQLSAWSCKMTFAPLVLTVNTTLSGDRPPMASLAAFTKPDGGIQYGVQPPALTGSMQLVLDLDYKMYGPAYHFSAMYDKIVVLSPEEFTAGSNYNKRDQGGDKPPFRHRFQVMPGDNPWFCIWNSTYIEGYIYVADNSSAAAFPTAWPSNVYGTSIPIETSTPTVTSSPPAGITPRAAPPRPRGDSEYPKLMPYPRIVKIEERRLPGSPQPYCQKMLLLENGQITVAPGNNGNPITVPLQEQDPEMGAFLAPPPRNGPNTNATGRRDALQKRTDPADACHCQWMFQ